MAYQILVDECTVCGACEFECPNGAISMKGDSYVIDAAACNECEGVSDVPQCETACPVPGVIVPA
ncbi:4Fe-4S binding protein [Roseospirillum parvum]|uniref:4Fe-4S binding domain-containing protein n=1 Tax=Roseospirillum parvum TaxID=83401 RepID=A0A1G7XXN0_9PROT|nr:4Fe-4S binding protein [Roseospirillum parvum]SDG88908.1 4Fe-4S binding domain-containing protein [Roseospirillum parvum]